MSPAAFDSVLNQYDPEAMEVSQISATYGKLYPLIKNDFRELGDCCNIHKPQNMIVTGSAGTYTLSGCFVTSHAFANPADPSYHPMGDAKQAEYKAKVEAGGAAVDATEALV
jgi:hypothetical protein